MNVQREIIFISNFIGNGGAARVISVLAAEFAKRGHKVSIIALSHYKGEEYQHIDNIRYIKFDIRYQNGVLHKIERILKLRKEIKNSKDAVIISFEYFMNMQTIVACFGLKKRLIVSERNDPARQGGKIPIKQLRNFLYRFVDYLVCQTPDAKAYFPTNIQNKSVVIANPIRDDLPEPWQGEREKVIVNFCRLEKQKNLPMLIDAFEVVSKMHPDYELKIFGDGREKEALNDYIKSKNLGCVVSIFPAITNIHEAVLKAAMFVSTSDYEGLSNSMLEAMAIGLPAICTDCPCGGARLVIRDGENGLLIPVGDAERLAGAISNVIEDEELRKNLSSNASRIREVLRSDVIVEEWEQLL